MISVGGVPVWKIEKGKPCWDTFSVCLSIYWSWTSFSDIFVLYVIVFHHISKAAPLLRCRWRDSGKIQVSYGMNPLQTADIPGTCTPLFVGDFITVISTAPFVVSAYNWIWLNTYHLCKQITAYTAARASVFGQGQVIEWTVGWCKYPHQYVEMAPIQRQANHLLQRVGGYSGLLILVNPIPPLHGLSDGELVITLWKGCGNAFDSVGD